MKLSRESEYGLEALSVLAGQPQGKVMLLREIAESGRLPEGFLAKVFQKLTRHNLVISHRGAIRGYALARPAETIRLREILEAIEGPDLFARCIFWRGQCGNQNPCRLHPIWAKIRPKLQAAMEETSLAEVGTRMKAAVSRGGTQEREKRMDRVSRR
jgi:Rrf2 family protein